MVPAIPAPPATLNAPVVVEVEVVVDVKSTSPPTYIVPAIPTPPPTVKAPVKVEAEVVVFGRFNAPQILALVILELPIAVVLFPKPTAPYPMTISFVLEAANGLESAPKNTL